MLLPEPIIAPRFASLAPKRIRLTPLAFAIHLAVGAATFVCSSGQALAQSAAAAIQYDIPAGPLAEALNRFALQSGVAIVVDASKVQGLRAPGLKGAYGVEEGFGILLRGSGYAVGRTAAGYVLVATPIQQEAPRRTTAESVLPAVTVTASTEPLPGELPKPYAGGQVARGSRMGILGNVDVFETPFSTQSYTADFIQDQQGRRIADIITADASVRSILGEYSDAEQYFVRGFPIFTSQVGVNGLYGMTDSRRLSPEFYERVDVLKGPASMLYGAAPFGATGGQINLVSKRAADIPLTRVTGVYVGDAQLGVHMDIGRRFGVNNEWGVRANVISRRGDTPISNQTDKTSGGSVALDYRGEQLRASFDLVSQDRKTNAFSFPFIFNQGFALPAPPDVERNYASPWEFTRSHSQYAMGRVEYDFHRNLTAYVTHGQFKSDEEYYWAGAQARRLINSAGDFTARAGETLNEASAKSTEVGLQGTLKIGAVSNKFSLAYSELERISFGANVPIGPVYSGNIYGAPAGAPPVRTLSALPQNGDVRLVSLSAVNTWGFMDDQLLLTLGLRQQKIRNGSFNATGARISTYDEDAVTPSAAALFKLNKQTSLYANYSEGFAQGGTAPTGTVNAGEVFAPFITKQYEAGIKYDAGTFGVTGAVFQIAQPSAFTNSANRFVQDGEQRNRGLELSTFGELSKGLRLLGSATYIEAIQTQTQNGTNDGKAAVGVPKLTLVANVEYDLPGAPGLTLTGRATRNSSQFADAGNTQSIPAWTRFDIGARYATRVNGYATTLRANVINLAGKNYWHSVSRGSLTLGPPRTLLVSATVDF